jgi:sulfonate transport system substrate-binding protein
MRRTSRFRHCLTTALALAGAVAGGAGTALSAPLPTLKVGFDVVPIHLAPVIFQIDEAVHRYHRDYDIQFTRYSGSAMQLQALATGELDLAVLAYSTFATGILNAQLPLVGVADVAQDGPGYSTVFAVLDSGPIHDIADLRGKVIADNGLGGAVDVAARSVLLKHHLKPDTDVTFIEGKFPAMEAMLKEGKIDVGSFPASFWAAAEAHGGLRKLFLQKDGLGTTQFLFFAATKPFISAQHALLVDFLEDYVSGTRYVLDPAHRARVLAVIAALTKQPESAFAAWALLPGKDSYHDPDGRINEGALQNNIDQLAQLGVTHGSFDVRSYVDNSLAEEAAKQLARDAARH